MRLYVLQHGDAVTKEENKQRPLSAQGREDIELLAEHLKASDVQVQDILHSGKLRAEQTAQIIYNRLQPQRAPQACEGINPIDDPALFIESMAQYQGDTLMASHMPYVSNLCSKLLKISDWSAFNFTPGTLACLQRSDNGNWSMNWMAGPEQIQTKD